MITRAVLIFAAWMNIILSSTICAQIQTETQPINPDEDAGPPAFASVSETFHDRKIIIEYEKQPVENAFVQSVSGNVAPLGRTKPARIIFTKPVSIGGKKLSAGTYNVWLIKDNLSKFRLLLYEGEASGTKPRGKEVASLPLEMVENQFSLAGEEWIKLKKSSNDADQGTILIGAGDVALAGNFDSKPQ